MNQNNLLVAMVVALAGLGLLVSAGLKSGLIKVRTDLDAVSENGKIKQSALSVELPTVIAKNGKKLEDDPLKNQVAMLQSKLSQAEEKAKLAEEKASEEIRLTKDEAEKKVKRVETDTQTTVASLKNDFEIAKKQFKADLEAFITKQAEPVEKKKHEQALTREEIVLAKYEKELGEIKSSFPLNVRGEGKVSSVLGFKDAVFKMAIVHAKVYEKKYPGIRTYAYTEKTKDGKTIIKTGKGWGAFLNWVGTQADEFENRQHDTEDLIRSNLHTAEMYKNMQVQWRR